MSARAEVRQRRMITQRRGFAPPRRVAGEALPRRFSRRDHGQTVMIRSSSAPNTGAAPLDCFGGQGTAGGARASAGPKAGRRGKSNRSERDFAGEITTGGRRPAIVAAARLVGAGAVPAAVEEGQRARIGGEVDLGAVAVVPLVVLPLTGGQLALDEHLRALDEVLLGDLAEGFVPDRHLVPLGPLNAVAVVVLPALAGRDVEGDDPLAALGGAYLGVATHVAD